MLHVQELTDKAQTGAEMYRLTSQYSDDINSFTTSDGRRLSDIPLNEYYDIVRKIPFKKDISGVEVVTRPYHLFSAPWRGWDCKKKSVAVAAWLDQNKIPYRFKAVSRRPDGQIHHVVVEAKNGQDWKEIDATYPDNSLEDNQAWTAQEILPIDGPGSLGSDAKLVSMYGLGDPSLAINQEFISGLKQVAPEEMGTMTVAAIVGVVTAIVGAVGGIAAAIISAVSAKRRQEREIAHAVEMQTIQQQQMVSAAQAQAEAAQQAGAMPGWIPWAALGVGAALFFL